MTYRNKKILDASRGEPCTMRGPNCNGDSATTVAAHSNLLSDGKGMRIKAHDCFVAFLCSGCHDWYDGRKTSSYSADAKQDWFNTAMKRTWLRLLELGVLK